MDAARSCAIQRSQADRLPVCPPHQSQACVFSQPPELSLNHLVFKIAIDICRMRGCLASRSSSDSFSCHWGRAAATCERPISGAKRRKETSPRSECLGKASPTHQIHSPDNSFAYELKGRPSSCIRIAIPHRPLPLRTGNLRPPRDA